MSGRIFWKKLKSMAVIAVGGSTVFSTISLYQGNEKFYKEIAMPTLHFLFSAETSQTLGLLAAKWSLVPECQVEDGPILVKHLLRESDLWLLKLCTMLDGCQKYCTLLKSGCLVASSPSVQEKKRDCKSYGETSLLGLVFSNPIGIAAGLDKNAEAPSGLFRTGTGFLEIGTVTPLPQSGNPKPRLFTLAENEALINRCGFNSKGHEHVKQRLEVRDKKDILGVNLGKNKESESAEEDYVKGILEFSLLADYFTINVSSPNTPGLRSLQKRQALENLLDKVLEARERNLKKPPILLKISPDLSMEEKKDIAHVVLRKGKQIDGLIISNTTISRPESLLSQHKTETGGLSGQPLKQLSTQTIKDMYKLTKGQIPIIGVGGVASGADAYDKIKAGASLIQLYTALAFEGPPVIGKIKRELKELLIADEYSNVQAAVGVDNKL